MYGDLRSNADLGEVLIKLSTGLTAKEKKKTGPIRLDLTMAVAAADIRADSKRRTGAILPFVEIRQIDPNHETGTPGGGNRLA